MSVAIFDGLRTNEQTYDISSSWECFVVVSVVKKQQKNDETVIRETFSVGKKLTAPGIPKPSPIQVLTGPNVA